MFGFTTQEEYKAKMAQFLAGALQDFGPPQIDRIERGPGVPYKPPLAAPTDSLDEMQSWQRLQFLVWSCDYRGRLLPKQGGCDCGGGAHHCLLRKGDPGTEHAVTITMCYACVSGKR